MTRRRVTLPEGNTLIFYEFWKADKREPALADVLRYLRYAVHLEEGSPGLLQRFENSQDQPLYIHLRD